MEVMEEGIMPNDTPVLSEEQMDRLSTMGRALYNEKLKAILKPEFNGQDVAIHLNTGGYEVGKRASRPALTLRKRHPEGGMIMITDVGPPRPEDMGHGMGARRSYR